MNKRSLLAALYGVLTVYALVTLSPFLWMLITSFKEPADLFSLPPSFVPTQLLTDAPFANYTSVLTERDFTTYFVNSLIVSTSAAVGQVITCAMAGYVFAKVPFRGRNFLFAVVLATAFVPNEVTIIPEYLLMRQLGWINTFLPLIVPSFLVGSFGTFMLREYFSALPNDFAEAGRMDGASAFRIFRDIYLPLSVPALISVFVVAFIHSWDELLRPILYLNSPELYTVPRGLISLVSEFDAQWTWFMAGSVISTLPLVAIYILAQRYVIQGFVAGGVK
ncbi:carbohydrate ABC transporter permease [Agrobacterium tumefaciens]|uniref:carbohydrate ABC transporter permease n=1 Tax=Agrobacterium tumefaciens TaxID=358 RepID=UPI002243B997|nr:carbohydrate ABC transporter permease [Agrobacterium tumefaciens]MCW8059640.1 carbohydrate ABC transporter permease [Agrobacterium tumefaciens]MCW8146258.1 carbohydrate ABC transporter permease [Agrobacterium tumefaciens]